MTSPVPSAAPASAPPKKGPTESLPAALSARSRAAAMRERPAVSWSRSRGLPPRAPERLTRAHGASGARAVERQAERAGAHHSPRARAAQRKARSTRRAEMTTSATLEAIETAL